MTDDQKYVIVYRSRYGGTTLSKAATYPLEQVKNLCDYLNKTDWDFIYWYEPVQKEPRMNKWD